MYKYINECDLTENDIITGEKIAKSCDIILSHYDESYIPKKNQKIRSVYFDTIKFEEVLGRLIDFSDCVLVTHNSDRFVTDSMVAKLPKNVIKWFCQNALSDDERIVSLPIGLENNRWFPNIDKKNKIIESRQKNMVPNNFLYVNHNISTNRDVRQLIYDKFSNQNWATCISNSVNGKNFDDYVRGVEEHFFVASPNGNGVDCHRTWEVLYMKRIPIVTKNSTAFQKMFEGLPVLIIDDWQQINLEFLRNEYEKFSKKLFPSFNKLKVSYWIEQIKNIT